MLRIDKQTDKQQMKKLRPSFVGGNSYSQRIGTIYGTLYTGVVQSAVNLQNAINNKQLMSYLVV